MKHLKFKIFIGYLSLIAIILFAGTIGFNELVVYKQGRSLTSKDINTQFLSSIFTDLFQAESLALGHSKKNLEAYTDHMDSIMVKIDRFKQQVDNPFFVQNLDSIQHLLNIKMANQKELFLATKPDFNDSLRFKAIQRLSAKSDSIQQYHSVYKKLYTTYDTIYVKEKKQPFFNRLKGLFKAEETPDSSVQIAIHHHSLTDSVINKVSPVDSIALVLTTLIDEIESENLQNEAIQKAKEEEILRYDRFITLQMRKLIVDAENAQMLKTFEQVEQQKAHLQKTSLNIILLGLLALITIIFFLINILKDVSKSQKYRKHLEESNAYADQLLKSKEQLVLSMTHDMKSPINSIMGFSELLNDDPSEEEKQHYLNCINASADLMLNLVTNLMDNAKLEQGKMTIEELPLSMTQLVSGIVENIRPKANSKNIKLAFDTKVPESFQNISDPLRISQILVNLLSNAVKFTQEGSITVSLKLIETFQDKNLFRISIRDTGKGISKETQAHIFEAFNRGDESNNKSEGTGLGLSITKQLVDLLDGSISLESEDGKGSCFTIELRLKEYQANKAMQVSSQANTPEVSLKGLRVWLVDDDKTMLSMLSASLEKEGIHVSAFYNPLVALSCYPKDGADVLITDVQMPEMNGFDLIKNINKKNKKPIRAFAISGLQKTPQQPEELGVSAFLRKPFSPEHILNLLRHKEEKIPLQAESKPRKKEGAYTLEKVLSFASGDKEQERTILQTLVHNEEQHISLLKKHIREANFDDLSKLAHKMLNIYRQLEASDVVSILMNLNLKKIEASMRSDYLHTAEKLVLKLQPLLKKIKSEHLKGEFVH